MITLMLVVGIPLVLVLGSVTLRFVGWFVAVAGIWSIEQNGFDGETVLVILVGIAIWFAGHVWFQYRHGYWKSRLARQVSHRTGWTPRQRSCHMCGVGSMVMKSGPHGDFLGCSTFPACRSTINL